MRNEILQSLLYVGLVYALCMCVLVPPTVRLFLHRENPLDTRWWWPLGIIVFITILAVASEGAIAGLL